MPRGICLPALPPAAETLTADFSHGVVTPNQLRWRPFSIPEDPVDFVRGLLTICGAGRWGPRRPLA